MQNGSICPAMHARPYICTYVFTTRLYHIFLRISTPLNAKLSALAVACFCCLYILIVVLFCFHSFRYFFFFSAFQQNVHRLCSVACRAVCVFCYSIYFSVFYLPVLLRILARRFFFFFVFYCSVCWSNGHTREQADN